MAIKNYLDIPHFKQLKKNARFDYQYVNTLSKIGINNFKLASRFHHHFWPFWGLNKDQPLTDYSFYSGRLISLINSAKRNWTYLSQPNSPFFSIIDLKGTINVNFFPFSVECWLKVGDILISPKNNIPIDQQFNVEHQSVSTTLSSSDVALTSNHFLSSNTGNNDVLFGDYTLKNLSSKDIDVSLYLVIRPYHIEGLCDIKSIQYLNSNILLLNKTYSIFFDQKPRNIVCLSANDGDIFDHYQNVEMIFNTNCPDQKASAFCEYRISLKPKEKISKSLKIPCQLKQYSFSSTSKTQKSILQLSNLSISNALENNKRTYLISSKSSLSFDGPRDLSDFFPRHLGHIYANHSWQQHTNYYFQQYNFSICDHLSQLITLYKSYPSLDLGMFLLTPQYFKTILNILKSAPDQIAYSGEWFEKLCFLIASKKVKVQQDHAKYIQKIMQFLIKTLSYNKKESLFFPKKRYCSHSHTHHFFLMDLLSILLAIRQFHTISTTTSKHFFKPVFISKTHMFQQELKKTIDYCCERVSSTIALTDIVPISFNHYTGLPLIYTLTLYLKNFPKISSRIVNTLSLIEKQFLHNNLIFSTVSPHGYLIKETIEYYLILKQIKPETYVYPSLLLNFAHKTFSLPSSIHPSTKGGSEGDGHSLAAGNLVFNFFLDGLIYTQDASIVLFNHYPHSWLTNEEMNLTSLQTLFGKVNLKIEQQASMTIIRFTLSKQQRNKTLTLHVAKLYHSFQIDDSTIEIKNNLIHLPLTSCTIMLFKKNAQ